MKKPVVWDMNPKPKYKYLCPIGHTDEERKHFHKSHVRAMLQHDEILGYAVIHLTFVIDRRSKMFPLSSKPEKKYYRLISVLITALGTGPHTKYQKPETAKKIGRAVRRLLSEARMTKTVQ